MSQRRKGSKHMHSQHSATIHGTSQGDVMKRVTGFELGSHVGGGNRKGKMPY